MPVFVLRTPGRALRRTSIAVVAAAICLLGLAFTGKAHAIPASGNFDNPGINVIPAGALQAPPTTSGPANPYPSNITVGNMYPHVTKVTVTLRSLSHTFPDDLDVLLVGPHGQNVLLMSDAGGSTDISNIQLTFDDSAGSSLPDSGGIASGTYRPTNYGAGDSFPAPAPTPPFGGTLSTFNGSNPNGTWHLYIVDDAGSDVGQLIGWSLHINAAPNGGSCTNPISGTSGADVFTGTNAGDRISGRGGDDRLSGSGGRDCISGSTGNDRISGGSGNDRISGGSGNDRISGGSGNDRISAIDGTRDSINCGSGRHDRASVDRVDRVRGCESVRRV